MKTKNKNLHRHIHPIHWHGSMILAVAALLLTSFKCSDEMLRSLRSATVPTHAIVSEDLHMREVETSHNAIMLSAGRHVAYSGR